MHGCSCLMHIIINIMQASKLIDVHPDSRCALKQVSNERVYLSQPTYRNARVWKLEAEFGHSAPTVADDAVPVNDAIKT